MHFLARLMLTVTVFGLLVAAACCVRPAWLTRMGLDVWTLPELWEKMETQRKRTQTLLAFGRLSWERMKRKEEAAAGLLAGRLSLTETAAVYGDLSDHIPAFWDHLRFRWPSRPRAEQLCRYAIECVAMELQEEPTRARQVVARLEGELADLLCSECGVTLP